MKNQICPPLACYGAFPLHSFNSSHLDLTPIRFVCFPRQLGTTSMWVELSEQGSLKVP